MKEKKHEAEGNIATDIPNGFELPENLMTWLELHGQVSRRQPCSKKALFRYIQTLLFCSGLVLESKGMHETARICPGISSIQATNVFFSTYFISIWPDNSSNTKYLSN